MIIHGDCLEEMKKMEPNSISAIVTDPPYGLKFMGKKWDSGLPESAIWENCRRIIKPGGFLLAMGGTRTFHRLCCKIEEAGFEIRDTIMWIYGSGFPKSHNNFGIEGYGTALKPAYEPIILAMKPCEGTFKQSADKWGQGGINIDECRIGSEERFNQPTKKGKTLALGSFENCKGKGSTVRGRWPSNVIFDEEAAQMLDEQSGPCKTGNITGHARGENKIYGKAGSSLGKEIFYKTDEARGASRFFYCAKASSSERGEENNHPTVKPLKLMEYLIKLVMPPKNGVLLDPFAGSGTTILAAHRLGFKAIGIEKELEYCEIAQARINNLKATA